MRPYPYPSNHQRPGLSHRLLVTLTLYTLSLACVAMFAVGVWLW